MSILLELFSSFVITLRYQHFEYMHGVGYELLVLFVVVKHLLDGPEIVSRKSDRNDLFDFDIGDLSKDEIHP